MSRPWMGYLAGAAFVLSTVGAAAAYAQGGAGVKAAQDQAAADSHAAPQTAQVVRIERHGDGADRDHDVRYERRIVMRHGEDATEHLRTMLQLKPNQEAALQAYVAAIHPAHGAEHIIEMSDHGDGAKTTTQKLADMEKHLAEQTAQAKTRIDATRKFYDQLEPSQKKVFDELPLPGPMMIMPGMGNMRVMVNMDGMPPMHHMDHMPPMPPAPPASPAPPRLDD